MKADNFCYWLQGFIELGDPDKITQEQMKEIRDHLKIVFKYDIDTRYGDSKHQAKLSSIHNPGDIGIAFNC